MHTRLDNLYNCSCDDCLEQKTVLHLGLKDQFKQLLNAGQKAFKRLHKKGSYTPEDLKTEKAYKDLIQKTYDVFNFGISDNDMPEEMLKALQSDAFLFGSLKANAQLFEASQLLVDSDGNLKPFSKISGELDKLNVNYNQNYLEAEYEFAVASSQSAAQWSSYGNSDRYLLQYRTAKDERVRATHQALADITLPKEDEFWNSFYPPNGWRCRCTAVEVLKSKYDESNSEASVLAGEKATTEIGKNGKNKLEIFRFNPGAEKLAFPPKHPYKKVKGAKEVIKNAPKKDDFIPEGIKSYEKKTKIKVNSEIFEYLNKKTPLYENSQSKNIRSQGAFFEPTANYVRIPIDERRLRSKWKAESVVYHEFGHAADWQNGFKFDKSVKEVMDKHRKIFRKDSGYSKIDRKVNELEYKAYLDKDFDKLEQCGAISDTIMSLNSAYGHGHSKAYFKMKGFSEAEFIAHVFENRFAGNPIWKELLPEFYEDTLKLADELKTKLK